MRKIYFISGFPRAGNTLLASILSQNPSIGATGQSCLPDIFYALKNVEMNSPRYNSWKDSASLNNVYHNIFNNYYQNWNKDYIIERADWMTPYNIGILQQYCPNEIKIVFLVRDVLDIIKSFLKVSMVHPTFYLNSQYNAIDKTTLYSSEMEVKADLLMQKDGFIDSALYSTKYLLEKNIQHVKFVEYENLIDDTEKVINEIYDFYEIPKFEHTYTNLNQLNGNGIQYDDFVYGAPIHEIHTDKIEKINNDIVLEENIIRKYSNLNIWR